MCNSPPRSGLPDRALSGPRPRQLQTHCTSHNLLPNWCRITRITCHGAVAPRRSGSGRHLSSSLFGVPGPGDVSPSCSPSHFQPLSRNSAARSTYRISTVYDQPACIRGDKVRRRLHPLLPAWQSGGGHLPLSVPFSGLARPCNRVGRRAVHACGPPASRRPRMARSRSSGVNGFSTSATPGSRIPLCAIASSA